MRRRGRKRGGKGGVVDEEKDVEEEKGEGEINEGEEQEEKTKVTTGKGEKK